MLRLVWRNLSFDPARSALTTIAIASVIAVILVLEGFYGGLVAQLGNAVMDRHADLIVTQSGVANMMVTRSVLPQMTRLEVESLADVKLAHPLTGLPVIYEQQGRRTPIYLFVYDTAGGPQHLAAGNVPTEPRDIVIDRSLARRYNLTTGDAFVVSDYEFRIAGVSAGTAAFFTPFGFIGYDDLIDFYFELEVAVDISTFPLLSFILVELSFGVVNPRPLLHFQHPPLYS